MNELSIAVRAVHFVAVLLLFGEFVFFISVARPALRAVANATWEDRREGYGRLVKVAGWSLAAAIASGILWIAVQAATMSGMPLRSVLSREILGAILGKTLFGRVSEIRLGLAIALSVTLLVGRRRTDDRGWLILGACSGLLAGGLVATLAWTGHAAAGRGSDRYIHIVADSVHLLAAGAWLGALPSLVFFLARTRPGAGTHGFKVAGLVTQRFSTLGVVSVGGLALTGAANTWYLVGTVPALFGTQYGRLLLLKLIIFAVMVTLAAINRLRLMPQLMATPDTGPGVSPPPALRRLWRNATVETILGFAIVAIVGALGVTIPGAHVQPVWPFPYTLSWEATEEPSGRQIAVLVAGAGAILAFVLLVLGAVRRRRRLLIGGLSGFCAAVGVFAWLLMVPAYPSTYVRSPVRYTVASITRGAPLFAQHCTACHGPHGYGDGPAAAALPVRPANLTEEHFFHHREGDLFWWLTRGISGTPMPGFGDRMSETQVWDVINFLRAQAEAEEGKAMNAKVEPWRPIVAPEFTFQIARHQQESLKQQRGRFITLLVLYTLPESRARLQALNKSKTELDRAGVRIVAVPIDEASAVLPRANPQDFDASLMVVPNPHVVATYDMFRRTAARRLPPVPAHMEFLIDREGYLRARWTPAMGQGWDQVPKLLQQIDVLNHEKPRPPAPEGHAH